MNYKKIYIILGICLLISVFAGSTFAWLSWRTATNQQTEIIFSNGEGFMCSVDGGGNITNNDVELVPTTCDNSEYAIKREIKVMPTIYGETPILMDLWLDINSIGAGLSESVNFRYALTTNPDSCTQDLVRMGNFNTKVGGDTISLLNYIGYTQTTEETYYLYIWLDEDESSTETMNQSFDLSLNGLCTNAPEPQTFVAFSEEDSTLRLYKRNESTSPVSNNSNSNIMGNLNNINTNYEIEPIDDVTVTEGSQTYLDLETTNFTSAEQLPWYEYKDSIKRIIIEDEIKPISTSFWFSELTNLEYIDVSKLNTSKSTSMYYMFKNAGYNASSFQIIGLDNWVTSNVTNMHKMFNGTGYSATTWKIGDLSNWDTSSVIDMAVMFSEAGYNSSTFNIGNIGNWNMSNVSTIGYMFLQTGYNATSWNIGDLSNWDVSNVTDMHFMFQNAGYNATTFDIGDLSNWDVSNVTDMSYMFCNAGYNATTFDIGDLSNWDVSKVTDMHFMFQNAGYNATTFDIGDLSNWDVSNVTNMHGMFRWAGYSATTFDIGDLSNWDVSKVTDMTGMFQNAGYNATTFDIGDLSQWDVSNVTNMHGMFTHSGYNATTFNIGNLGNWDTSNVINMFGMFDQTGYNATNNWSLDLSGWNVDKVISYTYFNSYNGARITPPVWVNEDQGDLEQTETE